MKFKCQQVCPYNTLSGCKVDEYYGICPLSNSVQLKESPKTNADRIRAMSDEELAECICKRAVDRLCEIVCGGECKAFATLDKTCDQVCKEIVLKWLQKPAKEDA